MSNTSLSFLLTSASAKDFGKKDSPSSSRHRDPSRLCADTAYCYVLVTKTFSQGDFTAASKNTIVTRGQGANTGRCGKAVMSNIEQFGRFNGHSVTLTGSWDPFALVLFAPSASADNSVPTAIRLSKVQTHR